MRLSSRAPRFAGHRHNRPGFALVTALIVLLATAGITALLYVVTIANQRRALLEASGSATQYAAEAGIHTMFSHAINLGSKGWLTTNDVLAVDTVSPPNITGITFSNYDASASWGAPVVGTWTDPQLPTHGMRTWTQTLHLSATATSTDGAATTVTQDILFEATPFAQATYTVFGPAEFYSPDPGQSGLGYLWSHRIRGLSAGSLDTVPAIRANGPVLAASAADSLLIDGAVYASGTYQIRPFNLLYPNSTPYPNTFHLFGSTYQRISSDSTSVGSSAGVQSYINSAAAGPRNSIYLEGSTMPSSTIYPVCQTATTQGIFGLQCRSTAGTLSNTIHSVEDTVYLDNINASAVKNGILYLRPKKAGNTTIVLKNGFIICCAMTIVSEAAIVIQPWLNAWPDPTSGTSAALWKPLAIVAPRIYIDHTNAGAEYVYAALFSGYQASQIIAGVNYYYGGVGQAVPWPIADDWGGDGSTEKPLNVQGAMIAFPGVAGPQWVAGQPSIPANGPTTNYLFDRRYLSPTSWPPGWPGRYRILPGPIKVAPQ